MIDWLKRLRPQTGSRPLRLFYYFNLGILLVTVALAPAMLYSIYLEAEANASAADVRQFAVSTRPDHTVLSISLESIDTAANKATLILSGHNVCPTGCRDLGDRIHLSTFHLSRHDHGLPASIDIDLPKNGMSFTREFSIPVDGNILPYPFDQWRVDLALSESRLVDGRRVYTTPDQAMASVGFDEDVSRLTLRGYRFLDPKHSVTLHDDMLAVSVLFERPFYTKYITTVMVLLLTIATVSTIAFSDYSKLIMSSAGIIFGLWGARSILIGELPPDSTYIDIVLILIVLTVLLSVACKTVLFIRTLPGRDERQEAP